VAAGADGPVRLRLGLVRIPDVCFVSWKRLGSDEVPDDSISKVIPELAIEILSKSNTRREIERKLEEYFRAGVLLAWVIDPRKKAAEIYTAPTKKKEIGLDGTLQGGTILPGFRLPLKDLFARGRRRQ
jgi:Uma2 family endonuclease